MSVTLKDIAADLGVSYVTVSNALRGTGRLGDDTRQRVLEAAKRLGYRPNAAARAVLTGRFQCVALVMSPDIRLSGTSQHMIRAMCRELDRHQFHLATSVLEDATLSDPGFMPRILSHLMCDGLLINYTTDFPAAMEPLIQRHQLPSVWLNSRHDADCVYPDDFAAGLMATQRLLQLGHERIAYVDWSHGHDGIAHEHYSVRDRADGYIRAMRDAGRSPLIVREAAHVQSVDRPGRALDMLRSPDRPTAVLTYGDRNAYPIVLAAAQLSLRIPDDLSIITFAAHDNVNATGVWLNTVVIAEGEIGEAGVRMLMKKLKHPEQPLAPVRIKPTLGLDGCTCAAWRGPAH